jgi:hypothetical protein
MTDTPTDDTPGFVAEEPEHCHACFRLIRPGQTYYLTIENTVLCTDCALSEGVIRVRDDLAVEVKRDRLLIGRRPPMTPSTTRRCNIRAGTWNGWFPYAQPATVRWSKKSAKANNSART